MCSSIINRLINRCSIHCVCWIHSLCLFLIVLLRNKNITKQASRKWCWVCGWELRMWESVNLWPKPKKLCVILIFKWIWTIINYFESYQMWKTIGHKDCWTIYSLHIIIDCLALITSAYSWSMVLRLYKIYTMMTNRKTM